MAARRQNKLPSLGPITVLIGGYTLLNGMTFMASLIAFAQSYSWVAKGCITTYHPASNLPVAAADACDLTRWFVYLDATAAAGLAAAVSLLVALRLRRGGAVAWRSVALGVSFSLALYLAVLVLGWFPPLPGSVAGTFNRDMEAQGHDLVAFMLDLTVPLEHPGVKFKGLSSAKAAIVLTHLSFFWGSFVAAMGWINFDADEDSD